VISVRWITLTNFRSFHKETRIDLRSLSGLVHLSGANGAGKSSIMDGLHWCLFGRTSRGVRAGNVKSWRASGAAKVVVRLEKDAVAVDLLRAWGPNDLRLNNAPVTQAEFDSVIGLTEDEFLHSAYRAQFFPSFLDLSPGEQLKLYSQVMQLERWERASERAAEETRKAERAVGELELGLAQDRGRLAQMEEEAAQLRSTEVEWAASQRKLIQRLQNELRQLKET